MYADKDGEVIRDVNLSKFVQVNQLQDETWSKINFYVEQDAVLLTRWLFVWWHYFLLNRQLVL